MACDLQQWYQVNYLLRQELEPMKNLITQEATFGVSKYNENGVICTSVVIKLIVQILYHHHLVGVQKGILYCGILLKMRFSTSMYH